MLFIGFKHVFHSSYHTDIKMTWLLPQMPIILQATTLKNHFIMKEKEKEEKQHEIANAVTRSEVAIASPSQEKAEEESAEESVVEEMGNLSCEEVKKEVKTIEKEEEKEEKAIEEEEEKEKAIEEEEEKPSEEKGNGKNDSPTAPNLEQTTQQLIEHIAKNLETESQLEPTERMAVGDLLNHLLHALGDGKLDKASLQLLRRAINYDRDMAQAAREGEVKGRNARIEEFLKQHRPASEIHQLGGTATVASPAPPHHVIGGLSAADRSTIWERGHEKRVRH